SKRLFLLLSCAKTLSSYRLCPYPSHDRRLKPLPGYEGKAAKRSWTSTEIPIGQYRSIAPLLDLPAHDRQLAVHHLQGVGASQIAQRRLFFGGQTHQHRTQPGGIAELLVVVGCRGSLDLLAELRVILQAPAAQGGRAAVEEIGAERPRLDDGNVDAELRHLLRERFRETFHGELRRAVQRGAAHTSHTGDRRDIEDVPGPLPAHHRQHRAAHVEYTEYVGCELPLGRLGVVLLEGA